MAGEWGGMLHCNSFSWGFFSVLGGTVYLSQRVYEWIEASDLKKKIIIILAHLLICGIKDALAYNGRLQWHSSCGK